MSKQQKKQHNQHKRTVPAGVWVRFALIGALWLWCVGMVIGTRPLDFWVVFTLVASAIVVFVPLYKKYVRNGKR